LRRAREGGAAGLATKGLDPLSLPMLAIADQCVNVRIGDAEVGALLIGTGIAVGVDPLGRAPAAFDLTPGTHRQSRRLSTRRGCGGETTSRTVVWAARHKLSGVPAANLGGCFRRDGTRMRKAVGT